MRSDKHELNDLAILGGIPLFETPLHVGRPNVGDRRRLLERINDALDRKWLTNNGPYVRDLERRIAELLGVKQCIAMCNGTVALEIATRALGLTGEVIVPSMTFIATAHALQWQQITPVFCDIAPGSFNIDPDRIEGLITPRTTGIVAVHLWAQPCEVGRLEEIAARSNLKLIFDAAHAFHCSVDGRMIGNFGDAEVFSFHATKFFNTFEGGAVVTNNEGLAEKIRWMKNFGFAGYDQVDHIGTNGKMSEISAAMGLSGLDQIHEVIEANRRSYRCYASELEDIGGVHLVSYDPVQLTNYQYIVLEIDGTLPVARDDLAQILWAENVLARRYFFPGCHRMEPYRTLYPHAAAHLPRTERAVQRTLTLPTGTTISQDEIQRLCELIRFVVANGDEIGQRLRLGALSEVAGA